MRDTLRIIPEYYADRKIAYRSPYTMPGELILPPLQNGNQFAADLFRHDVDKPFEVWRMLVRLTAFDSANPANMLDVQPQTMRERVRLSIMDLVKNQRITKSPALVSSLLKEDERTWEWEVPYTIATAEGFVVSCDTLAFPTICAPSLQDACTGVATVVGSVRVEVEFQGYLLWLN